MKKLKKSNIFCMAMLFSLSLIFLGCSKKTIPIEQTAKAFYDLVILQDNAEFEKLGMSDNDLTTILESQSKLIKESTKSNFVIGGLPITDEQLEEIYQSQMEALRKLTANIEVVSSDKEISQVKISTTYIDMIGADTKAANDTLSDVQSNQISDKAKISEIYINKLIENFKSLTPSSDVKSNAFEFEKVSMKLGKKTEEVWIPKDSISFGATLGNMSIGIN